MNHDEPNSHSDQNPGIHPWIEPELEARVVAWVAGEASAFEIAELERLTAERPELAIFKRRIEAVHGLVGEAVRPDKEPLRMSTARREMLLATIGASGAGSTAKADSQNQATLPVFNGGRSAWAKQWWLVSAAAC